MLLTWNQSRETHQGLRASTGFHLTEIYFSAGRKTFTNPKASPLHISISCPPSNERIGSHTVVLGAFFWLYDQESILIVPRGPYGLLGIELKPDACKASVLPLHYLSSTHGPEHHSLTGPEHWIVRTDWLTAIGSGLQAPWPLLRRPPSCYHRLRMWRSLNYSPKEWIKGHF